MIPKIIHYCWFGKGEMSSLEKRCILSWKKYCPGFQIKLWNEENFDVNFCEFTKEAYRLGKYAFVSDVARLHALNTLGGIYLDTDMLLLQPLPASYFSYSFFIGTENRFSLSAGVLGFARSHPRLLQLLEFYSKPQFDSTPILIPIVLNQAFSKIKFPVDSMLLIDGGVIFPFKVFYPLPFKLHKFHWAKFVSYNTIGVHLWEGTWKKNYWTVWERIRYFISKFYVPSKILNYIP